MGGLSLDRRWYRVVDSPSVEAQAIAVFALGYLIGSIDFGVVVPRLSGVDIYQEGSGNPGTANVLRTMGRRAAALTLLGDMAKGVAAAAIGDLWVGEVAGFAAGFAAVLGHSFPIWHRFRGGKGVATGVGVLLWMEPLVGVAFGVAWAAFTFGFRFASLASLILVVAWVPALALAGVRGWALVWAAATALLIAVRHSSNIKRLIQGQEKTISGSDS